MVSYGPATQGRLGRANPYMLFSMRSNRHTVRSSVSLAWAVPEWGSADRSRASELQFAAPVVRLGPVRGQPRPGLRSFGPDGFPQTNPPRIYPGPGALLLLSCSGKMNPPWSQRWDHGRAYELVQPSNGRVTSLKPSKSRRHSRAPNSNRCQSVGFDRQLALIRLSPDTPQ
jgi:hypothetical protein